MRSKIALFLVSAWSRAPLWLAQGVGGVVGWLFFLIPNRERRIADINIKLCFPELSAAQQRKLLRRSLMSNAMTLFESPLTWPGDSSLISDCVQVNEEGNALQEALESGRGVIAVGPHLGNWEIGLQYLTTRAKVTAIYRPPREKAVEEMVLQGRSRQGASLVPTTARGVKALMDALRRGEMAVILADQEPKGEGKHGAVFAPFFGHSALTMLLVNRLAKKTNAVVVVGFCKRLPWVKGFEVNLVKADEQVTDSDDVVAATSLNRLLEDCIRHAPEQYIWSYKRFSARPDNSPFFYSKRS